MKLRSVKHTAEYLDMGVSSVWDLLKNDPDFPRPMKISPRVTRWDTEELDQWIAKQRRKRDEAA